MPIATKDYDMFKKHSSNRELQESNVASIMKSISTKNMLSLRPILVNAEMQIIDGQHRLEAAKRLEVEICYEISQTIDSKDIVLLNANQRNWLGTDYLNYFCKEGYPEYLSLKEYMKKNSLDFKNALALTSLTTPSGRGGKFYQGFKAGNYTFPKGEEFENTEINLKKVQTIIEFIEKKTIPPHIYLRCSRFVIAIINFLNIKEVEFETLLKKIEIKLDLIKPCATTVAYMNVFREIYNYRSRNQIPMGDIIY